MIYCHIDGIALTDTGLSVGGEFVSRSTFAVEGALGVDTQLGTITIVGVAFVDI